MCPTTWFWQIRAGAVQVTAPTAPDMAYKVQKKKQAQHNNSEIPVAIERRLSRYNSTYKGVVLCQIHCEYQTDHVWVGPSPRRGWHPHKLRSPRRGTLPGGTWPPAQPPPPPLPLARRRHIITEQITHPRPPKAAVARCSVLVSRHVCPCASEPSKRMFACAAARAP